MDVLEIPFSLVDAFTDHRFAGNTAGVVLEADGLDTDQMRRIARVLGQTETCFVSATPETDVDFGLRWFTPTVEVDLCGHATVGAFVSLVAESRIVWVGASAKVRCSTRSGLIDVWLERAPNGPIHVQLSVGVAEIVPTTDDPAEVARVVGLAESSLDPTLPLAVEPASNRLIVPVTHLADLLDLAPNGTGMVAYGKERGYRRFTLICREVEDPACFVHLRHFAPANGIPEDPVTGTAHAVVAVYLDQLGLLPPGNRVGLVGEQGHAVGRRGTVAVEIRRGNGRIVDVRIGGTGIIVARGLVARPPA